MSTTPVQFDPKAYMQQQNQAVADRSAGKLVEKPAEAATPDKPEELDNQHHQNRAERRQALRQAQKLAAAETEARVLREMVEKGLVKPTTDTQESHTQAAEAVEPVRAQFATEAEYQRAIGRWEASQEARKVEQRIDKKLQERETNEAFYGRIAEMDVKFTEDKKAFEDWDAVAEAASEDEDVKLDQGKNGCIGSALFLSDVRASILYYLAKHPAEVERLNKLKDDPAEHLTYFNRIAGKAEVMYPAKQKAPEATKPEKVEKDRETPEKAEQARATAANASEVRKPKPSSEVATRGGTPAPETPKPGSVAWMEMRNRAQFGPR